MLATRPNPRANFDVGVLFYNRARQTLDCVLSFLQEEIKPNIVILDQSSAAEQRKLLHDALGDLPNVRFVTSGKNLGIAAGRNRLCRECSAEWIFFVDSDAMLNTDGGVALIDSTVAHAQNVDGFVPRILNIHENRFIDRLRLTRKGGYLRSDPGEPDSATTNLLIGCAALRRSFLLDNPFDERHFIGFEDFELALRSFTGGRPLRLKFLDDVTLVHKHMPVISKPDIESTQTRYSARKIAKSFNALKAKFGSELFDNWEPWVANQRREMIVSRRIMPRVRGDRINVTFVVDVPNWALDNVARQVSAHIGEDYALTIVYAQKDDDAGNALRQILEARPHVIHFLWRGDFQRLVCPAAVARCAMMMSLSEAEIVDYICQSHITFSVRDHLFLNADDIAAHRPLFWLSDGYLVNSHILWEIYRQIAGFPKPLALIVNGVDRTVYYPPERLKREKSTVTIGWVGNSLWGGAQDSKGLKTIFCPAFEKLRAEGLDVEALVLDSAERWRPREEVAALYQDMDIYVCTSATEGTPNPVLEAMACGVAAVATRVGNVPFLFGPRQQEFIVERTVGAVADALRRLSMDADLRRALGQENLRHIADHTWSSRAPLWRRFFVDSLARAHPDASYWRRFMIEKFYLGKNRPCEPQVPPQRQSDDRSIVRRIVNFLQTARTWIVARHVR